jgi:hypothetical protein
MCLARRTWRCKPGLALRRRAVLPNLILPWNRLAVLAFVLLVLCFTAHPEPTRLGMNVAP